jgi:2-amino-4-hydroxy-6-hydroxymethyldihydropteridine diphosphokinase
LEDSEWFINGVALLETKLAPGLLLDRLLQIETIMGRTRLVKWGPRIIDLDLLSYDQLVIRSQALILPHPEMEKRRFVVEPMSEIAPEYRHPISLKTMAQLREEVRTAPQGIIKLTG